MQEIKRRSCGAGDDRGMRGDEILKEDNVITKNSVILGLFLCVPMITKLVSSVISFNGNIVLFVGVLLCISVVLNLQRTFTIQFFAIIFFVILTFLLSFLLNIEQNSYTSSYFLNFVLYGASGMFLCSLKTNNKTVLKTVTTVFILFTLLVLFDYIPNAQRVAYDVQSMENSYTIIIGVSAAFLSWKYFEKMVKVLIATAVLISGYYLLFLSDCRGAVLALFILIAITILKRSKYKKLWIFLLCVGTVSILWGWDLLVDLLVKSDSSIRWIARFKTNTDITSGRWELSEKALSMILKNMFGNGIGSFENITNGQYTHNLFLQLLCEFGIAIGGAIAVYIVYVVVKSLFKKDEDEFELFLVCQFIPRLLLSSVYWLNLFFWVYLYIQITKQIDHHRSKGNDI